MTRVRLIRLLAPVLNGIDLSEFRLGDVVVLPEAVAEMLVKEGWAEHVPDTSRDEGLRERRHVMQTAIGLQ